MGNRSSLSLARAFSAPRGTRLSAIAIAVSVFAPGLATADLIDQAGNLPSARAGTSAVHIGSKAYVFGGELNGLTSTSRTNQIVAFDPVTHVATTLPAVLPSARHFTSAVTDGQVAYVFGGVNGTTRTSEIVRFDPATNSASVLPSVLPSARSHTSAVWDGQAAYVFGGVDATGRLNQIVRFDPASGSVQILSETLPIPIQSTSAVWDPDSGLAYIFGGEVLVGTTPHRSSRIRSFEPSTGTVATLDEELPKAVDQTAAAWVDNDHVRGAMIYGGRGGTPVSGVSSEATFLADIVRFTPGLAPATLSVILPNGGRSGTSAIWDPVNRGGDDVYVFGGQVSTSVLSGRTAVIRRHNTEPSEPTKLSFTSDVPTAGPWGTAIEVAGVLSYGISAPGAENDPIEGESIRFSIGSTSVSAITDENGVARAQITLPSQPGQATLQASFTGAPGYHPAATISRSLTVTKRAASLAYSGPLTGNEDVATVAATLTDETVGGGVANASVEFMLGDHVGAATTDSSGTATHVFEDVLRGEYPLSARFVGPAGLYDVDPGTVEVAYLVDFGFVFVDEDGRGRVGISTVTNEFQFLGESGDQSPVTGDGLHFVESGMATRVRPAPVDGLAVIVYRDDAILSMTGTFDLVNKQFVAVVQMANGTSYALRRTCATDPVTCPVQPECVFNQAPVKDHLVVHGKPFCS